MSGSTSGVRVNRTAIKRRLERNGGDNVFMVFKADAGADRTEQLMSDTTAAVDRANEVLPDDVWADAPLYSTAGPILNLDWIGSEDQNEAWLATFAQALEEFGYTGTVTAAPDVRLPAWYGNGRGTPWLTAYVAYTPADPIPGARHLNDPPLRFAVDPATTQSLCDHAVSWGAFPGAQVFVSQALSTMRSADPDVADLIAAGLKHDWMAGVRYLDNKTKTARSIKFSAWGAATYQNIDPRRPWPELVKELINVLTHNPGAVDLGLIRYRHATSSSWDELGDYPQLPAVDRTAWMGARRLWDQYVPDAFAIQLLTDKHLDKASDLSNWEITELTPDRYLVQARDLSPWFDGTVISYGVAAGRGLYIVDPDDPNERVAYTALEPDPEVLAAARVDFGEMIMTKAIARADFGL